MTHLPYLKKKAKVAYQLDPPQKWKIHDVFHVNLLKKIVSCLNHQKHWMRETLYSPTKKDSKHKKQTTLR
jgi:hypothetical protein